MYWLAAGKVTFIEFKFGDNKQSKDQIEFQAICECLGHFYYLCYDEATFWKIIDFNQPVEADIDKLVAEYNW